MFTGPRTHIRFSYTAPGETTPCDKTLSDQATEVSNDSAIPLVGDQVKIQVSYPQAEEGKYKLFRVVGREFQYTQKDLDNDSYGLITQCNIVISVTDA